MGHNPRLRITTSPKYNAHRSQYLLRDSKTNLHLHHHYHHSYDDDDDDDDDDDAE